MAPSYALVLHLLLLSTTAAAQSNKVPTSTIDDTKITFRPSLAIVLGVFAVMFFLTFLLLLYAKFCNFAPSTGFITATAGEAAPPRSSGVDKTVIESLPFFRFASLKGARDGLECAVCLSRFEDAELLRLLPNCKHAFHINCVDRWLEAHSSCPLCRHRVSAADTSASFRYSASSHSLLPRNLSATSATATGELDLELFVERQTSFRRGSSRFNIGSSFRKMNGDDALLLPIPAAAEEGGGELLHKFKHRIIVSDVIFNSRWSDVNSSDMLSLNSDMLGAVSSKRFAACFDPRRAPESGGCSSGGLMKSVIAPGYRCMSEIASVPRSRVARDSTSTGNVKRTTVWLPIVRRTVQWFAGREKTRSSESDSRRVDAVV